EIDDAVDNTSNNMVNNDTNNSNTSINNSTNNGLANNNTSDNTGTGNTGTGNTGTGNTGTGNTGNGTGNTGSGTSSPTFMCDVGGPDNPNPIDIAEGAVEANTCSGDVDQFMMNVPEGCRAEFTLSSDQELSMGLYRANGDMTYPTEVRDTLRFTAPTGGAMVRLEVAAATDARDGSYGVTTTVQCPQLPFQCSEGGDDLYESNDNSVDNPSRVSPGDSLTAAMCGAGENIYAWERFDVYTIEDNDRYQGCVLASKLTWPVTPPPAGAPEGNNRNQYRSTESLLMNHWMGGSGDDEVPSANVLRATWLLGMLDPERAPFFETPLWLLIPELDSLTYLDPIADFEPNMEMWELNKVSYYLYDTDYHIAVNNASYASDATIPEYNLDTKALCDFSCAPRPGDEDFGITEGDDWFDAYTGIGLTGLEPDLAFESSGRFGGFVRGIACTDSPYNGFVKNIRAIEQEEGGLQEGDRIYIPEDRCGQIDDPSECSQTQVYRRYPRDIDAVTAGSFGAGYVNGVLVDSDACTPVMRVSWEDHKPLIAWMTTHASGGNELAWTYDPQVSTVNDDQNPFFTHSSPDAAFSAKGWFDTPPSTFEFVEGDRWVELRGTDALGAANTVVRVGIAHNPTNGNSGTRWSARYYCLEDGAPQ
ncbi:MAG: hypothetical protein AAFX99_28565, partial [Myxococcota bacterium]